MIFQKGFGAKFRTFEASHVLPKKGPRSKAGTVFNIDRIVVAFDASQMLPRSATDIEKMNLRKYGLHFKTL
jgi:hypothetical protein